MASILDEIVEQNRYDLRKRMRNISFRELESMQGYEKERYSLAEATGKEDTVSIIAEIKKASPSKGVIRKDFDPLRIANQYREGGASALSILTEEAAFQGSLGYLNSVSKEVDIPLLRKDFITDPYQIKEARAYGADAVLLIVAITEGKQLQELHYAAAEFGLECLVECYSEEDFQRVDFEYTSILGVNNRDLRTFKVDVHRGIELLQQAPEGTVLVSESGLQSADDLKTLYDEGIHAALIGEHFMRQTDPGKAVSVMLDELHAKIEDENQTVN